MSELKFEKLVHTFKPEYNEIIPDNSDAGYVVSPQAYFRGACEIPGSQYNVGFQIFVKPFFLDKYPHVHEKDEYLIFTGGTFPNLFDWDADIEFTIGKGAEAETYKINAPTIIRIPAGISHCPLNFLRVDKPVFFQAALMMGCFGGTYDFPNGTREIYYNGPIQCVLEPEKKCNTCKKCLTADWQK
jgi:hypothetical protein